MALLVREFATDLFHVGDVLEILVQLDMASTEQARLMPRITAFCDPVFKAVEANWREIEVAKKLSDNPRLRDTIREISSHRSSIPDEHAREYLAWKREYVRLMLSVCWLIRDE
jgi:hypothetical protein